MKEGQSRPRNRAIAFAFAGMKIIEQWGTGIPRIIEIGMDFRVNLYRKQSAENPKNPSIDDNNQSIQDKNQLTDIQNQLIHSIGGNSSTKENARIICENMSNDTIFGRTEIMKITGLSTSSASLLINKLKDTKLVVPVTGKGKGKYSFAIKIAKSTQTDKF